MIVFLLIQTLPTFWTTRNIILRIFIFWIPNYQISRSPNLQISRFPESEISRSPDLHISRRRRRRRRLRTNSQIPTPRDQIRRKEPLLRPNSGTGNTFNVCSSQVFRSPQRSLSYILLALKRGKHRCCQQESSLCNLLCLGAHRPPCWPQNTLTAPARPPTSAHVPSEG